MHIRFNYSVVVVLATGLLSTALLTGCGKNKDPEPQGEPIVQPLGEGFIGALPSTFERVPVGVVENNQIVNKLLSSRKESTPTSAESPMPFDPNLVVTKSKISSELTSQEYAKGSLQKLLNDVSGISVDSRSGASFQCGKDPIKGQRVNITVKDSYYSTATAYYLSQLYIVKDGNGYLFSLADINQENVKNRFDSIVESLGCN